MASAAAAAASTAAAVPAPAPSTPRKQVRVWVDGCFDMMHYGHANVLCQARQFGDVLVVGVHNDKAIEHNKGPPVVSEAERYEAVRACRWADELVPDAPYTTLLETLERHDCDFCVHGDDITTTADGSDCYHAVKVAGRYRECRRTEGVSTMELIGRMLTMTKEHLRRRPSLQRHAAAGDGGNGGSASTAAGTTLAGVSEHAAEENAAGESGSLLDHATAAWQPTPPPDQGWDLAAVLAMGLVPHADRFGPFFAAMRPSRPEDVVVYVDGAFDLFHVGHSALLEAAHALGTHVLVGVHPDDVVNRVKGGNHPIMNLHERLLTVMACRWVDNVVVSPYGVTDAFLRHWNIAHVVQGASLPGTPGAVSAGGSHGSHGDAGFDSHDDASSIESLVDADADPDLGPPSASAPTSAIVSTSGSASSLLTSAGDPYAVAKQTPGMFHVLPSKHPEVTTTHILERIMQNRLKYEARNRRKAQKAAHEAHMKAAAVAKQKHAALAAAAAIAQAP